MNNNSIEELQERLEELHRTQDARLACGADDLDIREEIAGVETEIKELEYDINEENNNGNDTNVGSKGNSIEEDIKILENLKIAIDTGCVNFGGKSMYGCGYQEAIEHILSDYKRALKENELLRQQNISYKNNIHELKEARNK